MIQERIEQALLQALRQLQLPDDVDVELSMPRDPSHGDFTTNVALRLCRAAGCAPRQLAERIAAALDAEALGVGVELAGPGFLNFRLQEAPFADALRALLGRGTDFDNASGAGRALQVEFVSANPTGPLNVVSARAAAYGSTLAALLRACGHRVQTEFYVNDAGRQVELLGHSVLARWRQEQGEEVDLPADGYQGDYVRDLARQLPLAQAREWSAQPPEVAARAFGDWAVERVLATQRADLEAFGVRYDRWFRESELHSSGEIDATLGQLQDDGHVYESEGALFFRSSRWDDDKDRVLRRSGGTPTYFLADAAYHRNKHERGFETVIDVWGPDHHGHIVRMQALCRAFGYPREWLEVIIVQWVKLLEAGETVKMSKRRGQLVALADLIEEVGSDVARYFFLMRQHSSHLDFDLGLARTESDENPVYYVKYAHARICSVIDKARAAALEVRDGDGEAAASAPRPEDCALERLQEPAERNLVRLLLDWPGFLQRAAAAREPHRLTGYCEELARAFHKFYHECRIIQEDRELGLARLALCHATRRVLASALALMSIEAPRSM